MSLRQDGTVYEPHPQDPPALRRICPGCGADAGTWCGGFGDIHVERRKGEMAPPTPTAEGTAAAPKRGWKRAWPF